MEHKVSCLNPKCDDTSNHLWINTTKGVFHCWKCGWSGKVASDEKVLRFLKNKTKKHTSEDKNKNNEEEEKKELFNNEYTDLSILPDIHMAVKYLQARNITIELVKEVGAAYCHRGFLSGRIVFPIKLNENIVCIQGRTVYGRAPKYLTAGKKRLALFGAKMLSEYADYVILFEGIFDALKVPEHGIAILGKMLSDEQVRILSVLLTVRKVFIMFDADAREYTEAAYKRLNSFFDVTPIYLNEGDPGNMRKEDILRLCKEGLECQGSLS